MVKGVDPLDAHARSRLMSRIRGRGNRSTEVAMVKILKAGQIKGWRRHIAIRIQSVALGRQSVVCPDFVFPKKKIALFIDGCFWHGCPKHSVAPSKNAQFWKDKIGANMKRDRRQRRQLRKQGWCVIAVWEHCLKHKTFSPIMVRLSRVLDSDVRWRVQP
jgi:DNA mismatch endonuclease (patch repair protein)